MYFKLNKNKNNIEIYGKDIYGIKCLTQKR